MSIKIPGKLIIKYRTGRNGKFPVGELITSIGSFTVKDKALEQYSEGAYDGMFVISNIATASYSYNGAFTVYMMAKLDDFEIESYRTGKVVEPAPMEPDPVDDEKEATCSASSKTKTEASDVITADVVSDCIDADIDPDLTLFGDEIYQLLKNGAQDVKLDPGIGRANLRAQCDRIKQLGYGWEAAKQIWYKK